MVSEMATSAPACHLEDGDSDVPAADSKDHLTEAETGSSDSTETSTEESSEDDEDEERQEDPGEARGDEDEAERDQEEADAGRDPVPAAEGGISDGSGRSFKLYCEKCKAAQQQDQNNEPVNPRKLAKGRFQVRLEGEGTFQCSVTGLVFEISEAVLLRYSILSWSKFGSFLQAPWEIAGPIFDVHTVNKDASVLKSIQFPHSICLADPDQEMTFSILHMKNSVPVIEPTVDHCGGHVKWRVTSLSPVGPVTQSSQPVEHHGVVLIYKQLANHNSYIFHIYLAANNSSDIEDVVDQVQDYNKRYTRIEKPPTCKLLEGTYRLISEPEGDIKPQELKFSLAPTEMKGYSEAFFDQPPPFKLSLVENDTDETVWSATIREGDCEADCDAETRPRKRKRSRRRSCSTYTYKDVLCKKQRMQDESDNRDLSDKQLLDVAKGLGKEWKQVAIYLELTSKELDDIQVVESDVTMQKLKMLLEWKKRRRPGKASARHLLKCLEGFAELPNEVYNLLQDLKDS